MSDETDDNASDKPGDKASDTANVPAKKTDTPSSLRTMLPKLPKDGKGGKRGIPEVISPDTDRAQTLFEHLTELRNRLFWALAMLLIAFVVCFAFADHLYNLLAKPLADILLERELVDGRVPRMIFTSLTEPFFAHIRVAFFFALFVSCPFVLSQIWIFVAPGLYRKERSAFAPFLIASPILFLTGAALVWGLVLPLAWRFFLRFEAPGGAGTLPIELEAKVGEYLTLTMQLIFAFGLAFQLPVLMTLLARAGLMSAKTMAEKRRWAILGVFVFAAVFTPPDPVSQLSLAIPLIGLYEISIIAARRLERSRDAAAASTAS